MFEIRQMATSDLGELCVLSSKVGWNQIEADWARLMRVWPGGCFVGMECERIVATATLADYGGEVGWVGMVIVDEAYRGKGISKVMLDKVIEYGDERGVKVLGLDATDEGRRVYSRYGFVEVCGIDRWKGVSIGGDVDESGCFYFGGGEVELIGDFGWFAVESFDRKMMGVDRGKLLESMNREAGARGVVVRNGGEVVGYGMSRRGRWADQIGPIVGKGIEVGESIASELLNMIWKERGDRMVYIDAVSGCGMERWLMNQGFEVQRRLMRMVRGGGVGSVMTGDGVFVASGFELG